jgi:hypothetical protein
MIERRYTVCALREPRRPRGTSVLRHISDVIGIIVLAARRTRLACHMTR